MRLINLCNPEGGPARIWCRLVHGGFDLEVEECGTYVNARGEKLDNEIRETGIEYLLGCSHLSRPTGYGWDFGIGRTQWALETGIAPTQPFLVEIDEPHYYQSGGYEYPAEWDVDIGWEIVHLAPWKPEQILKAWDRWLKEQNATFAKVAEDQRQLLESQKEPKGLYLVQFRHPSDCDSDGWPYGPWKVRFQLKTENCRSKKFGYQRPVLAWGETFVEDEEKKALDDIVKRTLEIYPQLTAEEVLKLPRRFS